jgi:phage terminase small subunit
VPALPNHRWERFAQELAKSKPADQDNQAAGSTQNRGNATRLKQNERINARVAEIIDRAAVRAEVTQASLIEEAEEARLLAMQLDQPAAAIAAIKEKGVLSGVRVEKSERTNKTDARQLSDHDLDAAIADALAREEAAERRQGLAH